MGDLKCGVGLGCCHGLPSQFHAHDDATTSVLLQLSFGKLQQSPPQSRISCNERGEKESVQGRKEKKKFAMTHCGFAREASDALYARARTHSADAEIATSFPPSFSHSVSLLQDSIRERGIGSPTACICALLTVS